VTRAGFPKNRVLGQAGMLDTARFTHLVAEELGVRVGSVRTLTLGSHGATMVPGAVQVCGRRQTSHRPLAAERIEELVERTRNGGRRGLQRRGRHRDPRSDAASMVAERFSRGEWRMTNRWEVTPGRCPYGA
jgi:malate/lactate dehydrogenase